GGRIIYLLDKGVLNDLKFSTFSFENNPQGKFMLSIIFGYSKYYVDSLSENIRRGNRTKVENGWLPHFAPIGYLNEKDTRTISKDPERFTLVRKMWDLLLTGVYLPREILQIATDQWGLRTKKRKRIGGTPLVLSAIYKIFGNPFYAGLIEYNGNTHQGKHAPMITLEEFDRAQEVLGRKGRPRPKTYSFTYTGMIRCGECGFSVTAEEKINRYGTRYIYYHCTRRNPHYRCRQKYVSLQSLESQITDFLCQISVDDRVRDLVLRKLDEFYANEREGVEAGEKSIQNTYDEVAKSLENLTRLRIKDMITEDEYVRQRKELLYEQLRLKGRLSEQHKSFWFEPARLFLSFSNTALSW
ncbi:MAG: recombinase family protein, partial [Nitrososphaera sp.]|nr:recombinase family protein [Nitrososphaera sp.]